MYRSFARMLLLFVLFAQITNGQQPKVVPAITPPATSEISSNTPSNAPPSSSSDEYRLGHDDVIDVKVFEVPELGGTVRVSASGIVSLPFMGTIQVAGKTTHELEKLVEESLKKIVKEPHVAVSVREYASQPVSVIGAVKTVGIYQMKGQKSLLDMLALAGGIDQTNAGKTIQIIRKPAETNGETRTINVDAEDLFQNGKTDLNIPIKAGDVINVSQAGSIFVIGEVMRPGEFVLRQGKDVTAAQAIALASSFTKDAKKKESSIIRFHSDGTRQEIPVNVEKILDGTLDDIKMMPNDILFVPANKVKKGLTRALDTTISIVSGRLMYAF